MAKLFRHSPLNSIWEGSGNVIALDIIRGAKSLPVLLREIKAAQKLDPAFDSYIGRLEKNLYQLSKDLKENNSNYQRSARLIADNLAIALQGATLLRFGDSEVATGFIQSRVINANHGANYGGNTVFNEKLSRLIIARNMPVFY
jgi:putative acyl-CoA dehydrogenase